MSKFVTLTFKEHITSFEIANNEFKKFIQRMNYKFKRNLKYLVVPEFTKKGRIHFHVIFFDLGYFKQKELEETWKNGFVFINQIDNVDNVGAYICKYLSKDSKALTGKKSYFKSKNLKEPEIIENEKMIEQLQQALSSKQIKFNTIYENDYIGKVKYTQYVTEKT